MSNRFTSNGRNRASFRTVADQKAKELERSLADASAFPALSSKPVTANLPQMNFIEKVNQLDTSGVVNFTKPKSTPKPTGKRYATPYEIFSVLNHNYEKWKANYIEEYGEYEYERNYRFPNYDYEYFDKLDEKYEKELQEQEEKDKEREDAENADYEQYMDYLNDVSND
jgi:hypothetical protein